MCGFTQMSIKMRTIGINRICKLETMGTLIIYSLHNFGKSIIYINKVIHLCKMVNFSVQHRNSGILPFLAPKMIIFIIFGTFLSDFLVCTPELY